ncbi:MAG: sulfatase-like hydrolase/transferase, partial [Burkholderiaceae bacterium]
DMPNLASMLKGIGYKTALVGKWHLGYPPHFGPLLSGYDEHFGPLSGGVSYYSHIERGGKHDLYQDGEPIDLTGQYLTDLLSDRAVEYVRARGQDKQPFLLSLNYTAPHWPWETRDQGQSNPEVEDDITHPDGGSIHIYHQMIREMDEGIGRLVDELRTQGLLENTLIVFTSDNGGERFSDNWPLVGGKMDLTEGGIRVPYIVHWPAGFSSQGMVSEQHCLTMDWTVTMLEIAGLSAVSEHPFDGVSMRPSFETSAQPFARPMFWRMKHREQRALRDGDWKYLSIDGYEYLFNVEVDARERANRGLREPARLNEMRERYDAWHATMPPIPLKAQVSLVASAADMPSR